MSMSIGGLASGLDTSGIVDQLMQIEAVPQALLKNQKAETESFVTALNALNSKVGSLAEQAAKSAKAANYDVWKGTSSNASVTVTTAAGAGAGSLEFRVDQLAAGKSLLSGALADAGSLLTDGAFTYTTGTGDDAKTHTITPASNSVEDLAAAINADKDSGLKATVIKAGGSTRIQLTASATGAEAGDFAITSGNGESGFQTISAAKDAKITLWPGLGLEDAEVTSASNTFADLMPGVSLTVTKVSAADADPIKVNVARDDAAITKLGSDLVSQLNQVFSEISSRSTVTTSTDASGKQTTKGGIFTADSTTRAIVSRLTDAAMYPVNGMSPSTIGISLASDGTLSFDADKFAQAMKDDPAGTQDFLTQLAGRVQTTAESYSDKYEGSLTMRITSQQTLVTEYGKQIDDWDLRLQQRRDTLTATYTAMEVALQSLQAQSGQLSGQLSSMLSQTGQK